MFDRVKKFTSDHPHVVSTTGYVMGCAAAAYLGYQFRDALTAARSAVMHEVVENDEVVQLAILDTKTQTLYEIFPHRGEEAVAKALANLKGLKTAAKAKD